MRQRVHYENIICGISSFAKALRRKFSCCFVIWEMLRWDCAELLHCLCQIFVLKRKQFWGSLFRFKCYLQRIRKYLKLKLNLMKFRERRLRNDVCYRVWSFQYRHLLDNIPHKWYVTSKCITFKWISADCIWEVWNYNWNRICSIFINFNLDNIQFASALWLVVSVWLCLWTLLTEDTFWDESYREPEKTKRIINKSYFFNVF